MSKSIFCDICEKVLSQQKGEYDHGCLDCHGQPYSNKIFWLRKSVKQKDSEIATLKLALRELGETLEMVEDNTKMPHQHSDPQLRLYCLTERAGETLSKHKELLESINDASASNKGE